jgi:Fe-S oxidoreductase
VTQAVNAVNSTGLARLVMEGALGVDKNAWIPQYATKTFPQLATKSENFSVIDGKKTPGKVAIYATCYINYNEPGIGQDLIKILKHNQIPYQLVDKEACCGMPKLE